MNIKELHSDLLTCYNKFYEKYNFLNPFFILKNNVELTWNNYLGKEKFDTYDEYYDWVANNNQYSFMLEDESFIQIYFTHDDEHRLKGSMTYLPEPSKFCECFRFDMDYKNKKNFTHTSFHIHFGYKSSETRFSLFQFPTPTEFVRFILFIAYGYEAENFKKENFFNNLDSTEDLYNHHLSFITND